MAQQVYCNNCGSVTTPKVAGSIIITLILVWFAFFPAIIYEIWRAKNKRCRQCGSAAIMPLHSPAAQQALQQRRAPAQSNQQQHDELMRQLNAWKSETKPVEAPKEIAEQPKEHYAIDADINGGLIEFFGLQRWYNAVFDDEQKYRLRERFGDQNGNKLDSGKVRFKFSNVDILQFLYDLEKSLKPKAYSDLYKLVDEQFKIEAGKFCKIDDERWNNEQFYKSWFALMKYRIDALERLKTGDYFKKGQIDMIDDSYTLQTCRDISNKGFDILSGELDREFDKHFAEPIKGCRCGVRGYKG